MIKRLTVIAILIALMVSVVQVVGVSAAPGTDAELEAKWDQLIKNFNRQNVAHERVHNWAYNWLAKEKKVSAANKRDVEQHLAVCNSSILTAHSIVARHAGFTASGKLLNRNLAYNSIKQLADALRAHAASIKNMREHMK